MTNLDYVVLAAYFLVMLAIGLWAMRRVKAQEDYFMGGRSFGRLMQTFAAFGAGTGSADPINTARTTFTSGLSGMWSVMYWLFVTPLYWISGVWYRRMRHLTLGDWFVERYESRALGAAYTVFGIVFYIFYTAMLFTAVGKFAAPLMDVEAIAMFGTTVPIEKVLVSVVAIMVMTYGVLGGLTAAYWTDVIQGVCIILLSIILVPFGLEAIADKFQAVYPGLGSFEIMHRELPADFFTIVGSARASEFPLYSIVAIVILNMVGIVVTPHFIATGGGSARTETHARVGLVAGNLLKRLCTVGWALTALIAVALYADNPVLSADPDKTWGLASRELLGPGLLGLMLACLLAALMSSADAYMLVSSALVVRNVYAAYINPHASERRYITLGRVTGVVIIIGAVAVSWWVNDVLELLKLTWILPVAFAAPFWIGHFWRRTTRAAVWANVGFCIAVFFLIPLLAPTLIPGLRTNPALTKTNEMTTTVTRRPAAPVDVARRQAAIDLWEQGSESSKKPAGPRPDPLRVGDILEDTTTTGGKAIYWTGAVEPVGAAVFDEDEIQVGDTVITTRRYAAGTKLRASGNFKIDYLLYDMVGVDLTTKSNAMLGTLSLLPKIVTPFLIVILVSLLTARNRKAALDRYYVKMRTPVHPQPLEDRRRLEQAWTRPETSEHRKLFPGSDLEIQRPTMTDVVGFLLTVGACFGVIGLLMWIAGLGSS